jgi:hypothetical protein
MAGVTQGESALPFKLGATMSFLVPSGVADRVNAGERSRPSRVCVEGIDSPSAKGGRGAS